MATCRRIRLLATFYLACLNACDWLEYGFGTSHPFCNGSGKRLRILPIFTIKRLKPLAYLLRHGLPNIAVPVIAYHAVQLVYLIEGVVVVESLFAWPGSGHALVHAIIARDVPMIQGTTLVMGGLFVVLNTIADLLSAWIDPRIKR